MRNYKLHFVRHGMTEGNEKGQYLGSRTDSELSGEGIKQLIDLRECYEYPAVGVVYTSPMARCVQTTGIIYAGRELMMVPQLRELDFGDFEGKTIDELREDEDYLEWLENSIEIAPPNGESGEDFLKRIVEGIRFIIDDMIKSEVYDAAVVTHGGVIMTLMAAIGLPRRPMQEWLVGNGRGYTCFVNPQLWLRDGVIEVAGIMPHGAETAISNGFSEKGLPKDKIHRGGHNK
ncbi:MAG: histidine phosphatase family protein [Angelakisella sp.]